MHEPMALGATYLAFALFHAADAPRLPRWIGARTEARRWGLRLGALALLALACLSARQGEGLAAASLVVSASMCLSATFFVLIAATLPRVAWGLACLSAVGISAMLLYWVFHG
jgi:hypothetical protein